MRVLELFDQLAGVYQGSQAPLTGLTDVERMMWASWQDLSILGRMLEAVHSPPLPPLPAPSTGEGSESPSSVALPGRCNYDDYCQLKEQVPRSTRRFFTVHNFLRVRELRAMVPSPLSRETVK